MHSNGKNVLTVVYEGVFWIFCSSYLLKLNLYLITTEDIGIIQTSLTLYLYEILFVVCGADMKGIVTA